MRHSKVRYQLNRFTSWRKATVISLAKNVLKYQRIQTTMTRAKAARPLIEELITLAKQNTLSAKRRAYQILGEHALVSNLFGEIGPRFGKRTSGFVRLIGMGSRRGDNAELVLLELTEQKEQIRRPRRKKELKAEDTAEDRPRTAQEKPVEGEKKPKTDVAVKEVPPAQEKPTKKFLGNLRNIFKKERDSL